MCTEKTYPEGLAEGDSATFGEEYFGATVKVHLGKMELLGAFGERTGWVFYLDFSMECLQEKNPGMSVTGILN